MNAAIISSGVCPAKLVLGLPRCANADGTASKRAMPTQGSRFMKNLLRVELAKCGVNEFWKQVRSLLDLHVSFLPKLSQSNHGIGVDAYSRKEVCVDPVKGFCRGATQLHLHTLLHQAAKEFLV